MKKTFYITTTLPYVNADPHIGFALEIVHADIIARYKRLSGFDVFFNTGTDEHGLKIYRKAKDSGKSPEQYANEHADKFKNLKGVLGLSEDINFIRTTEPAHIKAAEEFWNVCKKNGYIYKRQYKIKYCVGCELEKNDSELVERRCPIHPNLGLEIIEEENYFFKFSEFQEKLLALYEDRKDFVLPAFRFNEIKAFVSRGLQDFSISRLAKKMPWGIPVPGDSDHVIYVWFDALVSYISTLGWPDNEENFKKWWKETGGAVQYCGKDNLRQQSAMWQAMLMAANIEPSKQIVIHGFVTRAGQKISKSLGNVVNPFDVAREYGTDALRYHLAREMNTFEDSDFTMEKFKEAYNAHLANGLGNLVARIMKMAEANILSVEISENTIPDEFKKFLDNYEIQKAADFIWFKISELDQRIQETQPFKLIKTEPEKAKKIIEELALGLYTIARMLNPIMPDTSARIKEAVKHNKSFASPLFPRKS